MLKKRLVFVSALMIVMAALLFAVAVGDTAEAARGGGGGKKGGGTTPACATCAVTVTPNPIPLNTTRVVVSGTGFTNYSTVYVAMPQDIGATGVSVVNGSFSWTFDRLWFIPGTASVEVYNNPGKYGSPLASTRITVCSTTTC